MNMLLAYEYRLNPSAEQTELINKHIGCARFVYNHMLDRSNFEYSDSGKSFNKHDLIKELPALKKQESYQWLCEVNSQSLQAAVMHLGIGMDRFFKGTGGYPVFKKKGKSKDSFEIPQNVEVDFAKGEINLPKFKEPIFCVFHREFVGEIRTCTVKRSKTGKYFISILVEDCKEVPAKPEPVREQSIGIDVGIKTFATTTSGEEIANPRHLIKCINRLRSLTRSFSRKLKNHVKGEPLSKNAEKIKKEIQELYEQITNQRKDFLHQLSTRLIRENQTICIELLDIAGMLKNRRLAKHIQDLGLGMFFSMLKYKAERYGKNLLQIGQFEPSSKTCHCCGHVYKELTLNEREWTCAGCGAVHDRDFNAAMNILNFAFKNYENEKLAGQNGTPAKSPLTRKVMRKPVIGTSIEASAGSGVERLHEAPESLAQG